MEELGLHGPISRVKPPKPIVYSVTFDPDALKMVCLEMLKEAGDKIRLHSWVVGSIVEDGAIRGVIVESKAERHAIRGQHVIHASGDGDVYASAGANMSTTDTCLPSYTGWRTWTRTGGSVSRSRARRRRSASTPTCGRSRRVVGRVVAEDRPRRCRLVQLPAFPRARRVKVEDLAFVEIEGRRRIREALAYARANIPGFKKAYLLDTGPQIGIRQTRLLQGEYVLTKGDIFGRGGSTTASAADETTTCRTVRCFRSVSRIFWSRVATIPRRRRLNGRAGRSHRARSWAKRPARPRRWGSREGQSSTPLCADAAGDLVRQGAILETKADPAGDFLTARETAARPTRV